MPEPTGDLHAPALDRALGPLMTPAGRTLARLPAGMPALIGTALAAGALALLLSGERATAGLLVLFAALVDAAGARAGEHSARPRFGAVLDGLADRYADLCVLAGMAAWSFQHQSYPAPLALGAIALSGAMALGYMTARVQASAGREAAALFGWTGRDVRMLILAAGAITGAVYWALVAVCLLTHLPVVWALARLRGRLTG